MEVGSDDGWRAIRSLDGLYERIAEDLVAGKPLVVATYCGQWDATKAPEDDIHWGTRFGPWRMFSRALYDEDVQKQFTHWSWEEVHWEEKSRDPVRTAVFRLEVEPNDHWNALGVGRTFEVYHVMLLFQDRHAAAVEAAGVLRDEETRTVLLTDGGSLEMANAQIVGYNGHNFYYDGPFEGLHQLHATPVRAKGGFVIGCKTAEHFHESMVDTNIHGTLFTTSFMAPEGYNLLALIDGIVQAKDGRTICEACNDAYRHFQVLGGQTRPGPLFVNQAYRLFDSS